MVFALCLFILLIICSGGIIWQVRNSSKETFELPAKVKKKPAVYKNTKLPGTVDSGKSFFVLDEKGQFIKRVNYSEDK